MCPVYAISAIEKLHAQFGSRLCFDIFSEQTCSADIHSLLADIGMEQESFESALQDHKRALELLSTILQVCQQRPSQLI